ncbi:MAG TPA: hypothetical protein VME23_20955 [Terracidiphilus sp.]|nr:hypothetical protein [Terracidiphilus sp.]
MRISGSSAPAARALAFAAVIAVALAGCESKQNKALDQAKKQAVATGKAQQVVTVEKDGTTVTTVVQPPASGQQNEAVTTTTTPPTPGQPKPAPSGPTVEAVPPPPPPPQPVNVTIPAGTELAIRIDRRISVKTSHAGDTFTGEVQAPVMASDGSAVIPKGADVNGVVAESHRGGHFKGRSVLELRLTSLVVNGTTYPLETADLERTKKGKGKRSGAMIGGGAGLAMLVGGVATGGVGLLVGGLVGGGAGTAAAGLTDNRALDIPAESVVNFKLADDLIIQEPAQQ